MRSMFAVLILVSSSCATPAVVRSEPGLFTVRDYLKTAYDTLLVAETDTNGHRIRAQLETRAALQALDDAAPAALAVALELLERSQQEATQNVLAQTHTTRAAAELRQALNLR
jgi:uncharacterized iron-regulated protein